MKRMIARVAMFSLFVVLPAALALFASCSLHGGDRGDPVVKAALLEDKDAQVSYVTLYGGGKQEKSRPFDPEQTERFSAAYGDFDCRVTGGEVRVELADDILTGEDGEQLRAGGVKRDILEAAAGEAGHDILSLEIISLGDRYFVYEKLNVNLWTPCRLFAYDENDKTLKLLGQWDDAELVGLASPESK